MVSARQLRQKPQKLLIQPVHHPNRPLLHVHCYPGFPGFAPGELGRSRPMVSNSN